MDANRWQQIRTCFDELVDLPANARAQRLETIGATDPELRDALALLLAADARSSGEVNALMPPGSREDPDPFGLSGRVISHFRVLEPLGSGGMGVVYRAEDTRLGRPVALKLPLPQLQLSSAAKERFLREARSAAALDHPNLCTIHEVGQSEDGRLFLAMPLYAGETLRARLDREGMLPIGEAVAIACQVAQGLACAHAAGIVHRDLKPANLMLLPDGTVKILDFGLAKARESRLTVSGVTLGTVAYMAPEQVRGDPVDARSDLWSLGVVLYESLAGRRPFKGETEIAIAYAVVHDTPARPGVLRTDIPSAVEELVLRLLSKEPDERPASATEIVEALESVQGGEVQVRRSRRTAGSPPSLIPRRGLARAALYAAGLLTAGALLWSAFASRRRQEPPISSLVVLPVENLSGDTGREYFVEGVQNALTQHLAQSQGLRVISRTSAMRYKGTHKTVPEIATELGVDGVVETAAAMDRPDTVRVDVRLVHAGPERLVWAHEYRDAFSNAEALVGEIAEDVAREVDAPLPERQARAGQVVPEAWDAYMRGTYYGNHSFTPDGMRQALAYLEEAIRLDPKFAQGHAALAMMASFAALGHGGSSSAPLLRKARTAALAALALDDGVSDAHVALGLVKLWNEWDAAGAEREFSRAIALAPSSAWAHYGRAMAEWSLRRYDSAIAEQRLAQHYDPLSPIITADLGKWYYSAGRPELAVSEAKKCLVMQPDFPPCLWVLGVGYRGMGRFDEAIAAHERAAAASPFLRPMLAETYALAGRPADARRTLAQMDEHSRRQWPFVVAVAHAAIGERDSAFAWFEVAYRDRDPWLCCVLSYPPMERLRGDARFQSLLRRIAASR